MDPTNQVTRSLSGMLNLMLVREKWVRGTVISEEGSMVNVHVDNSVLRLKPFIVMNEWLQP